MEIELKNDKKLIIDEEDYLLISQYKWNLDKDGYLQSKTKIVNGQRKNIKIHRLIMNPPSDMTVDHINHNKLDNRKSNLRICTRKENCRNTRGKFGKKLPKGIFLSTDQKRNKKYKVQIGINGKQIFLGRFASVDEAILVYNTASIKYFGKFGFLNTVV